MWPPWGAMEPPWMAAQRRSLEEEEKDHADRESAKLRQNVDVRKLAGREEVASKQAADRNHASAGGAPQAGAEESGSELLGTWAYGDGSLPTKYTISRTVEGWLRVDERLPNDVRIYGILQPQGRWLQTKLCSSDGTKFGTMRLRYVEEDDVILSNVKAAGGATWGADVVGRKEGKAAKQPDRKEESKPAVDPEAPSAADLLSEFFDTIKNRESAQRQPSGLRRGFFAKPSPAPVREPEPIAIAVANTAVTAALGLADPLAPFGYSVKRLKPAGGRMTCTEATPSGAPLLALPLAACWTQAAATAECAPVATALSAAVARNPSSSLLRADHTWIALHILHEKQRGGSARDDRKAHLALFPPSPETLLSWSARDLEALHGSRWQEATKQRMVEVMTDFHKLVAELGPAIVSDLGLDAEGYTWARQVVQNLGMNFVAPDGTTMLLVAPGLELLAADEDVAPSAEGARLEFTAGSTPTLVLYATKQYQPGDAVALSHAGVACSTGFRLLGCGQLLEGNPFEAVDVTLKIPVVPESLSATANLWEVLEGLEAALRGEMAPRPGDCLPPELAEARPRVEVVESRKQPEVLIHLRLSRRQMLPEGLALWYLGLALTAHSDRMGKIMEQERDVVNPLGPDACARRALSWLGKRIQWAIEDGPSRPLDDAERIMSRHSGDGTPRRVLGLRLVAAERQLLSEVAQAIQDRLAEPVAPRSVLLVPVHMNNRDALTAELLELQTGEEPREGGSLGRAVAQLRGCTEALEQLASRFRTFITDRNFADAAGAALKEELKVLDGLLAASLLEPMAVGSVSPRSTRDAPVKVCKEAHAAALAAAVARFEWDAAKADKENQKEKLQEALVSCAKARVRLMDFAAAQGDFQRLSGLQLSPSEEVVAMARTCSLSLIARSDKVLAGNWAGSSATLTALREKMRDLGYMRAGARWPWPTRVPPVDDLADIYRTMWDEGSGFAKEARKARTKVPSSTWWVMKEAKSDLRMFIGLFILRQPLPLSKAVPLLGADACKLLLERSALSCYSQKDCKALEPAEAAKLVSGGKGPEVELVANVSLWPADSEVLVAVDFEQGTYSEGGFEPVVCLAEDSRAMLAAASRQPSAKRVLDVCCGSGAHGIAALKRSAESAVFMDTSERSLRFAGFSAVLNGVEGKATFVNKSFCDDAPPGGPFQAILAGLPTLPNPDDVMNRGGPIYKDGGMDGQRFLEAVIAKAPKLLSKDGTVTATCMVRDVEGLASRIETLMDEGKPSGFRGTVFRGEAMSLDRFVGAATVGCNHAQRSAYYRGMYKGAAVQTMSEVLLLLWAPPAGQEATPTKAEIRSEHRGLWSDQDYLWLELERLLLAAGVGSAEEPLYELDWADGQEGQQAPLISPVPAPGSACPSGLHRSRISKDRKEEFDKTKSMEGATWSDIAQMQVEGPGFTPPVLCDVVWRKSVGQLKNAKSAFPHVYSQKSRGTPMTLALLELMTCQCPEQVTEAMKGFGVQDRLTFDGSTLNVYRQGLQRKSAGIPSTKVFLSTYDVLVIPLTGWQGYSSNAADLPTEVLALFQTILKQVHRRSRPVRIVLLTCGSVGPSYVDWHGTDVPAPAPLLGLVRSLRCEVPQLPVIWMDTDALAASFHGPQSTWAEQAFFELELATPKNGIWGVSTQERALWMISNNRDVAYRDGQRYVQKLDVSPAMPIYLGREVPPLSRAMAEGAVLVTGGVGGIGLVAAEALVEAGARCLVLSSRSGEFPKGLGIEDRLEAMRNKGVRVAVEKCDTGKEKDVMALLERMRESYSAVSAVVHTSGLMAEKGFADMEAGGIKRVFDPKAEGASYLHRHTLDDNVGAFVMFSSTSALRGSRGQANYAAANAYLDELARLRASQGLPAVSIQWPKVDLSGAEVEGGGLAMTVSLSTVKQVVKQLVCGCASVAPVQAVLPTGYLVPSTPALTTMLEPVLAKAGPSLQGLLEEAARPGKKGR